MHFISWLKTRKWKEEVFPLMFLHVPEWIVPFFCFFIVLLCLFLPPSNAYYFRDLISSTVIPGFSHLTLIKQLQSETSQGSHRHHVNQKAVLFPHLISLSTHPRLVCRGVSSLTVWRLTVYLVLYLPLYICLSDFFQLEKQKKEGGSTYAANNTQAISPLSG